MTYLKSSLIAATLVVLAAGAASAQSFVPTNGFTDLSPAGIAATEANIATLGVSQRAGDTLTTGELSAIQRIVLDQGSLSSKAQRVELIVNGASAGFGPGYALTY